MCHKSSLDGITHNTCATQLSPIQTLSLFAYKDNRISRAIILGKYKFVPAIYAELGHMLALFLKEKYDLSQADFIIPIPLSPQRKRWRGFNQAEIVAAQISINSNIPLSKALIRNKNTKTQKDLNKKDRLENMKGSFEVSAKANLKGKHVLLIDDVLTTGSTLLEATKALKEAGVTSVICVTLARD
ncbi:MAG: ComF family protein [Candidatus Doudnabacteria bacterium]|nr:ComF family protein [Candidatus Doudnabacteria bacterium]